MAACTASAVAEAVYKKSGFEVKKTVEMDLSPFGKDEVELRRFMVREPRPSPTATRFWTTVPLDCSGNAELDCVESVNR